MFPCTKKKYFRLFFFRLNFKNKNRIHISRNRHKYMFSRFFGEYKYAWFIMFPHKTKNMYPLKNGGNIIGFYVSEHEKKTTFWLVFFFRLNFKNKKRIHISRNRHQHMFSRFLGEYKYAWFILGYIFIFHEYNRIHIASYCIK